MSAVLTPLLIAVHLIHNSVTQRALNTGSHTFPRAVLMYAPRHQDAEIAGPRIGIIIIKPLFVRAGIIYFFRINLFKATLD